MFKVIFEGNTLFFRFFYLPLEEMFYITPLPGEKEGISASCIGGQSIIINKYISEEKKIAAGKIVDFFLSKESQKKNVINNGKISAMKEVYYDDEVCSVVDCNLYKNLQLVSRPIHTWRNYDEYSLKFRTYIAEYLFGNVTAKDTLQRIDDITFISYIDYSSITGMGVIIISVILITIIFSSFIIILKKENRFYLIMYNKSSWFIMLLGLCIFISTNFTLLGQINEFKCVSHILIPIIGMSFFAYPTLIYEIIYFPEFNKFSEFIKRNKLFVIVGLILINFIYGIIIYFISPFQVKTIYANEGKNYNICVSKMYNQYIFIIVMYIFKFFVILSIAVLTFIEYNLSNISNEMKTITILFYCNSILMIILICINNLNLGKYFVKYFIKIVIMSTIGFINYVIIVWIRMYYEKNENMNIYGVKIVKNKQTNNADKSIHSKSTIQKTSILSKIINYHYYRSSLSINKNNESSDNANMSITPELNLYTSLIPSNQMTDVSNL